DLRDRWEDDVLSLSPNWVSVLIGINDLNRTLAGESGLDPESFYANYREILRQTMGKVRGITLMTPFFVSNATGGNRARVLQLLPKYVEAVKKVGDEFSAEVIDLYDAFARAAKDGGPLTYSLEAIHPSETGHMLIALKLLDSVRVE
ncbi:MAG: GDSL-type esterase/lipase family protein, partial [Candidatus Marsarchaeota archaeon]